MPQPRPVAVREPVAVAFQRPDRLPLEVEVLNLEALFSRRLDHDVTAPHRIQFHAVTILQRSSSSHAIDFETHPVAPNSLLIVQAGQVQAFAREMVVAGRQVIFTPAFLQRRCEETIALENASRVLLAAGPVVQLDPADATSTLAAVELLDRLASAPGEFAAEAVGAAFSVVVFSLAALAAVRTAAATREPEDPLVARFMQTLEAGFTTQRTAVAYARALHVSLRTLDRRLVASRSVTAHGAIMARTLLEAKRLLTRRELAIKAIAAELGFSEPQNFTRFFRNLTGTSPAAFRRALDRTARQS